MMDRTRTARQRKSEGAHYTPVALADFVAAHIADAFKGHLAGGVKILDPACGDGSLLVALVQALQQRDDHAKIAVTGFDTSADAISRTGKALGFLSSNDVELRVEDFLEAVAPSLTLQAPLFDGATAPGLFDAVIANPPYVRTQVLGAERAQRLAQIFALDGRVDLYFAFVQAIRHVLKPGGVAGIIVSNRFMTTQAGASMRQSIQNDFEIIGVFDLGDTRLFEAAVLPAVVILRQKSAEAQSPIAKFTSIYSVRDKIEATDADTVFAAITAPGLYKLPSGDVFEVKQGRLDFGVSRRDVWRLSTDESNEWLARVTSNTAMTFGDVGPIRVGIKTTADKVFIRSDWDSMPEDEKPELLRPLITHHGAKRFRARSVSSAPQVLYTHVVKNGRRVAVDLTGYPKSARYLEKHRDVLAGRSYVSAAGRKWYEIWVPQDPDAWTLPKLVFRDISEEPIFWLDREGGVVNGDCYWLAAEAEKIDLLYLAAAVGNSTFIESFYDRRFNNKLYSGRRRFMTQYVRDFPLPDPESEVAKEMIAICRNLTEASDTDSSPLAAKLDALTWTAFGLT